MPHSMLHDAVHVVQSTLARHSSLNREKSTHTLNYDDQVGYSTLNMSNISRP